MGKQGFTLIELMVVVVIIGILAVVAVPKLFGAVAKSKASEVEPAAGTYIKLQDAFVSSKGDSVGSWERIGYAGPGTPGSDKESSGTATFHYEGAVSGTIPLSVGPVVGWQANNKVSLNDCAASTAANPNWKISLQASAAMPGTVMYVPAVGTPACGVLTPQFLSIQ
jgi:prepilin-type N-terminal cleavage/methylation domain-containing protein